MSEDDLAHEMHENPLHWSEKYLKLKAKNERLTLRATALVEDTYRRTYCQEPSALDVYMVNAVLLWLLRKEVESDG